jgi:hypothetical protein
VSVLCRLPAICPLYDPFSEIFSPSPISGRGMPLLATIAEPVEARSRKVNAAAARVAFGLAKLILQLEIKLSSDRHTRTGSRGL